MKLVGGGSVINGAYPGGFFCDLGIFFVSLLLFAQIDRFNGLMYAEYFHYHFCMAVCAVIIKQNNILRISSCCELAVTSKLLLQLKNY